MQSNAVDYLVIGAGIVGLALAREIKKREPRAKITLLEKEETLGRHASGRNSGVLHSGIFYKEDSVKAKVCSAGSREMAAYCDEHRLPILRTGKVIVPIRPEDDEKLSILLKRAQYHKIPAEMLDEKRLKEIEPSVRSLTGKALHLPTVAVVEPMPILNHIANELQRKGVQLRMGHRLSNLHGAKKEVNVNGERIAYGHLLNTAGLHADEIAHRFGVGMRYRILPFKGAYYRLSEHSGLPINGLVYAAPDSRMPFLGIHFSKRIHGEIFMGPTVAPAFSRENYRGLKGFNGRELFSIARQLLHLYIANHQGFRNYVIQEGPRLWKPYFLRAVQKIAPDVKPEHLQDCGQVGIRAQLVDIMNHQLVTDFLVEHGENSTHILNAVSPAFTGAFPFARLVLDSMNSN